MSKPKTCLNAISASLLFFAGLIPTFADSNHQQAPATWITNKWRDWPIMVDEPAGCRYNIENPNCVLGSRVRLSRSNYDYFMFERAPGGTYLIKWYEAKKIFCLDVWRDGKGNGTPVVLWGCHGGPNQQWRWESYYKGPNKGITRLVSVSSGRCFDVENPASVARAVLPPDNAPLQIWDCFPDKSYVHWRINQSWEFKAWGN
ncbi:RICIN domain-containing protein [Nonomuraea sp. NPDC059194]|uniref:RICIN domain-containing protein n=1 Tax=Nonomuraea sp. NPDC059194 TaxID=3346764 RepID=UPI00368A6C88